MSIFAMFHACITKCAILLKKLVYLLSYNANSVDQFHTALIWVLTVTMRLLKIHQTSKADNFGCDGRFTGSLSDYLLISLIS